jgi:dTMP kinase
VTTHTGKFITFEGGEGAGKTTQAKALVERLRAAGVKRLLAREPGGTPVGEQIRAIVKGDIERSPRTELLLFEAARAELVDTVIRPALLAGTYVVADRFSDSTIAYQGFGRGLDIEEIRLANRIATGGLIPDLTILLDIDPAAGLARSSGRDADGHDGTQFEAQSEHFHRSIATGFRELAAAEPERWRVIDASGAPDAVSGAVWAAVSHALGLA